MCVTGIWGRSKNTEKAQLGVVHHGFVLISYDFPEDSDVFDGHLGVFIGFTQIMISTNTFSDTNLELHICILLLQRQLHTLLQLFHFSAKFQLTFPRIFLMNIYNLVRIAVYTFRRQISR